ncbi:MULTISPECIES: DUF4123 domain-containing protein [unclassified Pseudomonas]|uniref:DUF4123 domain-containing protein n=1 Tax=unclassified Pseudomonas TaxID=196821 RepID=UPI00078C2B69|nr:MULTISPECIES: DUF4123 domain-containing protein [unclassified Pseudomonas]NKF25997.1 DUF4123 domain-containing protein [Pseudomonas sp. BG5]
MTDPVVQSWLFEQHHADRLVCLVLDSQNERDMRQRWLKSSRYEQYASVYGETVVAELADTGPFLFTFDQPDDRRLDALLDRPDSHWGWLASLGQGELNAWVRHWQERLLVGTRPHQALYRFHDNRVLARALEHLPPEALPAYLGPAISVCYWQGSHWQSTDNPAPGTYPLPDSPPWLHLPMPDEQAMEIRLANAHRFLLAEHVQAYSGLAGSQDPHIWLRERLTQAQAWGWLAPERLEFLLIQSLHIPTLAPHWQPRPDETPDEHFDRVYLLSKSWSGEMPS